MSDFPTSVYSPRTIANRNGVVYDSDNTKTFYAEDLNKSNDEIVAIETKLAETSKCKFYAYRNSALSIPNTTITKISFDQIEFDLNDDFNDTTGEYTVPVDGYYFFSAQFRINSVDVDKRLSCLIYKGSNIVFISSIHSSVTEMIIAPISGIIYCEKDDVITAHAYHEFGSSKALGVGSRYSCNFFGYKLP